MALIDAIAGRLNSILSIAETIKGAFKENDNDLRRVISKTVSSDPTAIATFDSFAARGYDCVVIAKDPSKFLFDVIKRLGDEQNLEGLNPINVMTKLANAEFLLDINGSRVCYAIQSQVPSHYLLKTFACKNLLTPHGYYENVDQESCQLSADAIAELDPLYNYETATRRAQLGGKKRVITNRDRKRRNVRREAIELIVAAVRADSNLSKGIVFVQYPSECSNAAIDIIFTSMAYKNALVKVIGEIVSEHYIDMYSTKTFLHADNDTPYEFRLKKYTCLFNHNLTKQPVYIANIYNFGTFTPIPCVKDVVGETFIHHAHPLVRLRLLYMDMYFMERKLGMGNASRYEQTIINNLTKVHNDVSTYNKAPTWVGVYDDEAYAKNRFNMMSRVVTPIKTVFL